MKKLNLVFLLIMFSFMISCSKESIENSLAEKRVSEIQEKFKVTLDYDQNLLLSEKDLSKIEKEIFEFHRSLDSLRFEPFIINDTESNSRAYKYQKVILNQHVWNLTWMTVTVWDNCSMDSYATGVSVYSYSPLHYHCYDMGMGEYGFDFRFILTWTISLGITTVNVNEDYDCVGMVSFNDGGGFFHVRKL